MQVQIVARGLASRWPGLARLDDCDIARQASRFRGGDHHRIIRTFLNWRVHMESRTRSDYAGSPRCRATAAKSPRASVGPTARDHVDLDPRTAGETRHTDARARRPASWREVGRICRVHPRVVVIEMPEKHARRHDVGKG